MFNYKLWRDNFLAVPPGDVLSNAFHDPDPPRLVTTNDGQPGDKVWRIKGILKFADGGHNLFMDFFNENNDRINHLVAWGWDGQQPHEYKPPIQSDVKPFNEPGCNLDIYWGQRLWAEVEGLFSDRVENIHTMHTGSEGHTSYYVLWKLEPIPVEDTPTEPPLLVDEILEAVDDFVNDISGILEKHASGVRLK